MERVHDTYHKNLYEWNKSFNFVDSVEKRKQKNEKDREGDIINW